MNAGLPGRGALTAILMGVIEAEVVRQRGLGGVPFRFPESDAAQQATLDEAGLSIDSLEQMGVKGAIEEMFGEIGMFGTDGDPVEMPPTIALLADCIIRSWRDYAPSLTVQSSDTTDAAKLHRHAIADLMEEARDFASLVGHRYRVVAFLPPQHIYGLMWTALVPEMLGAPVFRASLAKHIDLRAGDLIVAVPHQWRALSRRDRFPGDIIGISAGDPMEDADAEVLMAKGLIRLINVYGASETGGIAFREAPSRDYMLLRRWRFDQDRAGTDRIIPADGAVVSLPDRITRFGDRFRLDGRHEQAVQVGGVNVSPDAVARLLCEHDSVAEAAVRLRSNGRLKAFLVPRNGVPAETIVATVSAYAVTRLPAPARPVAYNVGVSLPRGPLGKALDC